MLEVTGHTRGDCMSPATYDVIVIGAGPAGEVAGRLATKGDDVAIVESDLVGSECSFYACMPPKALLAPSQALAEARRVPGAAQAIAGALDVAVVLARRDEVVHDLVLRAVTRTANNRASGRAPAPSGPPRSTRLSATSSTPVRECRACAVARSHRRARFVAACCRGWSWPAEVRPGSRPAWS
jgi:Pyridine nucleotide-disulphide oxidoreductase